MNGRILNVAAIKEGNGISDTSLNAFIWCIIIFIYTCSLITSKDCYTLAWYGFHSPWVASFSITTGDY